MDSWIFWMGAHWVPFPSPIRFLSFFLPFFWSPFWVDFGVGRAPKIDPKRDLWRKMRSPEPVFYRFFSFSCFFPAFSLDFGSIFNEKSMFFPLFFSLFFSLIFSEAPNEPNLDTRIRILPFLREDDRCSDDARGSMSACAVWQVIQTIRFFFLQKMFFLRGSDFTIW